MNQFNQWTKSRCWIKEEEQKESCYQEKTARRRLSRVVRATPCIIYALTTHCITVHKSCSIFNSTGKGIKKKRSRPQPIYNTNTAQNEKNHIVHIARPVSCTTASLYNSLVIQQLPPIAPTASAP